MIALLPVFFPVLTGLYMLKAQIKDRKSREKYVVTPLAVTLVLTLITNFGFAGTQLTFAKFAGGIEISFDIDSIAVLFGTIFASIWLLVGIFSLEYMKHEGKMQKFFAFYLMTFGVTVGLAFSANMLTMYLCYEALTFITLPLVTHSMDKRAEYAGKKYLIYSVGGASLSFVGMMLMMFYNGSIEFSYGGVVRSVC